MCHSEETDGFRIICHNPNIEYIKEILEKKNTKNIDVYTGPHHKLRICESEFEEQCTAYFERYFEISANEEPLILPWKVPHEFKSIANIMSEWSNETNDLSNIKGLVLHSFSIVKHLFRLGFTKKILQDCLQIQNFSEAPIFVVYNPREKALLLLRKAQSKKLATDIALSMNDLKLFILLFHNVLVNSGMKLVPLVVTDEEINPDKSDCQLCLDHVLSLKEFPDNEKFKFFWRPFETEYKGRIDKVLSKTFSAKLVGVLGATLLHPNYIPIFTKKEDVHQHMEHLAVLLTPEQLNVYYSEYKHVIVKGGFGCGKSIIAAVMLQKILEGLEEDEKLIHVCYDPRSELLSQMVNSNHEKSIDKVVTFNNKDGLKLSEIIEHVTKQERSGKINFIVDEYDGEDLDELEAGKLNRMFSESLKESFILLIPQPIEKKRVINKIPQEKYQFHKLETMKTYNLRLNIRNSVEIHQLVEATKEALKEEKTVFLHPKNSKRSAQLINMNKSSEENSKSNLTVSLQKDIQQTAFASKHEFGGHPEENSSNFKMRLDEAQAVIGSPEVDASERSSTESKFAYAVVNNTGHQINTKRPVLFELGNTEEFRKYLSLAAICKQVHAISSKYVVLHFHAETDVIPNALRFAFERNFNIQKKITTKYKEFESSGESILVCSFPTFRGLEYPIVTVLIDRNIYFVQHYLVEALARCTSELFVVVLKDSPVMTRVTTKWKTKELISQWEINISSKATETREINFRIDENQKTMNVTFKPGYYKQLGEAFKQLSNSKDETIKRIIDQKAQEIIYQNR